MKRAGHSARRAPLDRTEDIMRVTATSRKRRATHTYRARHAIPCIAVVFTLGDAVHQWASQRATSPQPTCALAADRQDRVTVPRPAGTVAAPTNIAVDSIITDRQ
jgi:hypothetical protein